MTENFLEIEDVLKFESLEAIAALKIPKIQTFSFRKEKVCLFGLMAKTSVLSDKNVPLKLPHNFWTEV